MSEQVSSGNGQQEAQRAPRKRRSYQRASGPRPAFVILQVQDADGNPVPFDKRTLKIVSTERSAERVMEAMESGEHPNAFYLRVLVPAGSRAGIPNKPRAD